EALALIEGKGSPGAGFLDLLGAGERAELAESRRELLFILAEAVAEALPGEDGPAQARQALELLARAGSQGRAYHARRARYLDRLPDPTAARRERAAAAAAEERSGGALDEFLLGEECYRRQDLTAAVVHLERALQHDPRHFWAQYLLANCYLRTQRLGEARAALTACLHGRPRFVWALLHRGFALTQLSAGRPDGEAAALLQAAEDDFRRALSLPRDTEAEYVLLVHRGLLRLRQDHVPEAAADFEAAVQLRPREFAAHVNLAQARERQGRIEDALHALSRAIEARPGLAMLYRTRARLHLRRGDANAALADLDAAIRLETDPRSAGRLAEDHKERGALLAAAGQTREALDAFDAALQRRPHYAPALRFKAEVLRGLGRPREALAALDRYLAVVARARDEHLRKKEPVTRAYLTRAALRIELGLTAGAVEDYGQALAVAPDPATYALRGWAYVQLGAATLALRDFDEALAADRSSADARAGRGMALALLSRTQEALAEADEAARLAPRAARVLYAAARVYALAAARADGGKRPAPAAATRQADQYRREALSLLERSLNALPTRAERSRFWRTTIQADAPLTQALQRERGFLRLADQYSGEPDQRET
ncbi:MAG TPA: tetratricopeptide repeat protein, partial [Gemmataceae bacterium]